MSILSDYWNQFQAPLFPFLETSLKEALTVKLQLLVRVLDMVRIERYIPSSYDQNMGRTRLDRRAIARAFIAKAVYDVSTTEMLIEKLELQPSLRSLCGFERRQDIPSSATFSRAFAEFAKLKLGDKIHEALVQEHVGNKVVMHVSRDSTEVAAREKPTKKEKTPKKPKGKRGRPKKGEIVPPKELPVIVHQLKETPEESLAGIRKVCDVGAKRDSKGNLHWWIGWKLHVDWADGALPLNAVTSAASVHDSQLAIPMARITARRARSLYDLMDSAYDAEAIKQVCKELDHVAIIDPNKRSGDCVPMDPAKARRYNERSTAERGNSRLKDEFGLRHLRVRGHAKAHMHIMFGVLVLFADQMHKIFGL